MFARRYLVYLCSVPLVALACVLVAVVPVNRGNEFIEHFCIGLMLGTMYGVTTIAAAWSVLGPSWLGVRLPLSLVIVTLLLLALGIGMSVGNHPREIITMMAISLTAQWVVSQIPLWGMAFGFGLRLRHRDDPLVSAPRGQFGIRQLMIFTAIIGVLLGIGRVLVANVSFSFLGDRELPIFLFLVGTAIVMTLPLVFAAFLSRYALLSVMACLVFIGLVTLAEWPLIASTFGVSGGPDLAHLLWINSFTTLWVLAFVGVARVCGYQFHHGPRVPSQVASAEPAR